MKLLIYAIIWVGVLCLPAFSSAAESQKDGVDAVGNAGPEEQKPFSDQPVIRDTILMPVQDDLGKEARETLGYLMFMQALLDQDEAALLEAMQLMAQTDAPTDVWLDGGVWLMSRKSPNSVVYLEQAIKAVPDDVSLLLLYAEALGEHDMVGRGIDIMRDFLKKHPDSIDAKIELALLLVKDKKFTEAQKILGAITGKQRTPLVDFYQGEALIGMDRRKEAIPYFRKAVKGLPDFSEALAKLAFLLEQEGNLKEARTIYERLQKQQFSPQQVALRLVELSLRMKQPEKALQYVKKGPESLAFKLGAANAFMESRHFLQAETLLKQIADEPNAPVEVYLLLAELVYEQRKNLKQALEWIRLIPPNTPGAEKGVFLEAQLLAEAGKGAEALALVEKAKRAQPNSPELADLEIRLLTREKKLMEALQAAEKANLKWPANPNIGFLYGSILDETGNKAKALEIMEEVIRLKPDHYQALNYIGYTLADENREIARALDLLKKANELAPNQGFILDSLAWAYFRADLLDDALREIRAAVALPYASDPSIWEHYGDIAAKMGKREEAAKAYRKALEHKPSNEAEVKAKLSKYK